MDIPDDALVDESFCDEFQQLSQIVEELHGFSFTNTIVPLQGEQPYTNITCIEFDHKENLLWVANDQGHVTSFYRADLTLYSKFWWSLDKTDLIPNDIITTDAHIIFVGRTQINIFTRGGAPILRHIPESIKNINCGHWSPQAHRFLYFGGEENSIGILELNMLKEIKSIETEEDCCLIRSTDRFLVTSSRSGQITVRTKDYNQYKIIARVVAHNAGVEDFDVFGNYLICCGNSHRQNGIQTGDAFMKVYDVRNLGSQAPVGFSRPPKRVRFVPGIEGCICVSTGFSLFMVDFLNNKTSVFVNFSLPSDRIAISNSGQAIAASINNYTSYVQLFCNSIDPAFSVYDIDSVFPFRNEEPFVPFEFNDKTSLAVFSVPYTSTYCSDKWTSKISTPRYLYPAPSICDSKDQTNNTKDVRYFKSPFVNTLVSGFNVWQFDGKAVQAISLREPSKESEVLAKTAEQIKVNTASPVNKSIMSKYQNASEFVPGRQLKDANSNGGNKSSEKTSSEVKSQPITKPVKKQDPKPSPTCLQSMSFEQFRALAEETLKSKEANKQQQNTGD